MPSHMPSDWTDPEIPGFVALPVERNRQQEVFTPTEFPENWGPQIFYEGRFFYEVSEYSSERHFRPSVADQATDQSGGPNFLSCQQVVSACSRGFPSIAPLSGSAGLGSLSSTAVRYLGSGVWYAQIFEKITFSRKLVLSWRRYRGFGLKNRNLRGFSPDQKAPKTNF